MSDQTRPVRLVFEAPGIVSDGLVEIDGVDISHLVYALDWHAEIGYIPELRLRLRPVTGSVVKYEGTAVVGISNDLAPDVVAAIILAGWTPPEGAPDGDE